MFAHSRNVAITGGSFVDFGGNSGAIVIAEMASLPGYRLTHHRASYTTAFKELQKASAPGAFHNSATRFDPPKCHPNTRVAVLEYIMGWIFGRNDPEALILWLYGPAGAGKSAILQTIAEHCFERKVLLASFFFGRSDPTRNTFKPLIATIAYQIATTIPEIKPYIETAIDRDPLIFDKSIATQLQSLILEPLKHLTALGYFTDLYACARLILIDGLDECDDPKMQSMILRALADALCAERLPLIFLIASRPEQHISRTFNSPSLAGLWSSLVLDDLFKPDDDFRLFLTDSFQEIKATHPYLHLIPEAWPEPSDVDKLVQKSSGQFIYASVVVKYVSEPLDRPPHRLEVILGLRPTRGDVPFAELDALYMHILDSCTKPDAVLLVLGVVVSRVTSELQDIEMVMELEEGDVEVVLAPLTSLIILHQEDFDQTFIRLCHASFGDFLVDISRSGRFNINMAAVKENIAIKCLRKIMDPYSISGVKPKDAFAVLANLWKCLQSVLYYDPWTEEICNVLKEFSLPQFWSTWSFKRGHYGVTECKRMGFVYVFLEVVSDAKNALTAEREQICAFHLSSFESIFKSELRFYFQDEGLMSLVVVGLLNKQPGVNQVYHTARSHRVLFRVTEDHSFFLAVEWEARRLVFLYRYLFMGPNTSAELYLDGGKYCQTALWILEFLCDHPPHPILCRKNQPPKVRSTHNGQSSKISCCFLPGKLQTKWPSDISLPRKRRAEKHRHGVTLFFRLPDNSREDLVLTRDACILGLSYLPPILGRSSKSPELMDFIRTHGENIAFIPKLTRKAIRAMYEYLDRPEEYAVMVDLSARFEAMVIQ